MTGCPLACCSLTCHYSKSAEVLKLLLQLQAELAAERPKRNPLGCLRCRSASALTKCNFYISGFQILVSGLGLRIQAKPHTPLRRVPERCSTVPGAFSQPQVL